jgi:hypothetical protein
MQLSLQQRTLLFWGVCLPVRVSFAKLAYTSTQPTLQLLAAAISVRWLSGTQVNTTGAFGGAVWWADERRLHGLMWASYAATGHWQFLAIDAVLGGVAWLQEHKSRPVLQRLKRPRYN